ncbi:MAG TPA: TonB family protein [Thermoanaerobaculia bacterium]
MFETVAPASFGKDSRRIFYETLPLSIAIHLLAVAGWMVSTIWQVAFPSHSPKMTAMYSLLEVPPPPPPPPPPAAAKRVAPSTPSAPVQQVPTEVVAPTIIPETIPLVLDTPPVTVVEQPAEGVEGGVEGGIIGGVAGGHVDGVEGGQVGGQIGGTIGGIIDDGRVHVERDKKLPMYPLSQVYPGYPEEARLRGWEDECVVRYVIGTNGRVKEASIIKHAQKDVFEKEALKAIRNWRFRPLIKNGVAQEVVHELTIFFRLNT